MRTNLKPGRLSNLALAFLVLGPCAALADTAATVPSSLQVAIEKTRYRIEPTNAAGASVAYRASNPAQRLIVAFEPSGVRVRSEAAAATPWRLEMDLKGWGYGTKTLTVPPAKLAVSEDRIEYRRGRLTEWYVNGPRGVEQGFTLERPPASRRSGELVLRMAVSGDLEPSLSGDGRSLLIARASGELVLRFAGLKAFDAAGCVLPSRMELRGRELALLVDDSAAIYPVTVDPLLTKETKLSASDRVSYDYESFGISVAIDGDTAVVGAPAKDGASGGIDVGAAYVFVKSAGVWIQQQKLTASDGAQADYFGRSVSISGDTAVVGAYLKNGQIGAAYVFVRSAGVWSQQQKLTALDPAGGDEFGFAVALSGNTALIAAPFKASSKGAAYVFVRSGSTWSQETKLAASDGAASDQFGYSVSLSGNTAVIGSPRDDFSFSTDAGSAYVFLRSGTAWNLQQKLTASDFSNSDKFGYSVAISGDTVVVGAYEDFAPVSLSGSAYVFVRSGTAWRQQQKLAASDAGANDEFGYSVAVSGDLAVIGSPFDSDAGSFSGSAYVFVRSAGVWSQQQKLTASDAAANNNFGQSVAISLGKALAGAPYQNGAAYMYEEASCTPPVAVAAGTASICPLSSTPLSGSGGVSCFWFPSTGLSDAHSCSPTAAPSSATTYTLAVTDAGGCVSTNAPTVTVTVNPRPTATASGWAFILPGGSTPLSGSGGVSCSWTPVTGLSDAGSCSPIASPSETTTYTLTVTDANGCTSVNNPIVKVTVTLATEKKLTASDAIAYDQIGASVAVSGDTVVVGAPFDGDVATNSGAAYVFVRSGATWVLQQKLKANGAAANDVFGISVAISGDTLVVGADGASGAVSASGAAYVFVRSAGVWTQQQKLTASDAASGDYFGVTVAISGDTVVVGAPFDGDAGSYSGSAYVFARSGGAWTQQAKLTASDAALGDQFGNAVAVSGDTVAIGAPFEDYFVDSGAAYVFSRTGGVWIQQQKLRASDAEPGVQFGYSVAVSGDTVLVGSPRDYETFSSTEFSSVYVFVRTAGVWSQQQKLRGSDAAYFDRFGQAVAISGDTVVVGSVYDDDRAINSGSAYVFTRSGSVWTQQLKLLASDAAEENHFGFSVAISGPTAVIGSPGDSSAGYLFGSAYVYEPVACVPPTAVAGGAATICVGSSTPLAGSGGPICVWSPSTGLSDAASCSPTASPSATTTYTLTVTDASGCVSTNNPTVTVTVYAPTAAVSGSTTICASTSLATIQAALTGTPPWNLIWSDGVTQSGVAASPATRSVGPPSTTTYTVTAVSDANCTGTSSGSAVVTVNPYPIAQVSNSGPASICLGQSTTIQAALTGTSPWNLTWSDGVTQTGITSSPATRTVSPGTNTTYTVTAVSDANCAGPSTGSAVVAVNSAPFATVSAGPPATICAGESTTIQASLVSGTTPWSVTWSDGVTQTGIALRVASRSVSPGSTTTYTVTAISDANCSGTASGSAVVTVNPRPTASVSGSAAICAGSSTTIQAALTGTGPWSVTWSDLVTQSGITSSPVTRNVSPLFTTSYTAFSVSDAHCSGASSGSAVVTVNQLPTAFASGSATILLGGPGTTLHGSGGSCSWSPATGLSSATSCSPLASPSATTTYTLTVTNGSGCASINNPVVTVTVLTQVPTTTSVASPLNPSNFGSLVILTATVAAAPWTPTGTVTFMDGAVTLGTRTLSGPPPTATATFSTSALSGGDHSITAVYGGQGVFIGSTSAPLTQTVNRIPVSFQPVSPMSFPYGFPVTLTAYMSSAPVGINPTGNVTFRDGVVNLGTAPLDASGHASLTIPAPSTGLHPITAFYPGDTNFLPGTSVVSTLRVTNSNACGILQGPLAPSLATGANTDPQGVAAGDFDGDGKADLVSANFKSNSVSVFLSNGDGTFRTKADYSVGTNPISVAVADFNGDGHPDLAVANAGSGNVSVLLNAGNGTFLLPANSFGAGSDPQSVAVGDFNGDGIWDIVVSNQTSANVSVLLGNGDGTFRTPISSPAGTKPSGLVVGDFDGDHIADVVVANYDAAKISILIGNGDGTFRTPVSYATLTNPASVAAGYFDDNGFLDLAVANWGSSYISVLLGNGDGTFKAKVNYGAGSRPVSVVVGDFNGDGLADLAAGNSSSDNVSILLGKGDGTFQADVLYAAGNQPHSVAVIDVYGNGKPGLVVANELTNDLSILPGACPTTTTITSATSPTVVGQTVTFNVHVTATVGNPTPTGVVTFRDGATALGTATLGSGFAMFSTSALCVGTRSITAVYGGDTHFKTSTSPVVKPVVQSPTIDAPASVCPGSSGNIASVPYLGPGTTYLWTITNGTITSPGGAADYIISWTALTASPVTLKVTVKTAAGCTASDTATVTNTAPSAVITAPAAVCAGSTGIIASVPSAGPGAIYTWSIDNGTITSGAGTYAIKFTAGPSGSVTLNVTVTNANGCVTSGTKNVLVNPLPVSDIAAPAAVCAGSTGNPASVADAGAGASYTWLIVNGTVTSGAGTKAITWKAGTASVATLKVTVKTAAGCSTTASTTVVVNPVPSAVITDPAAACPGSTGNDASVPDAGAGASYAWGITNGTIESGAGTKAIKWTAGSWSPVTLTVTVTNSSGCSTTGSDTVTNTFPSAAITAPASVCAGSTGNAASVPSAGSGATYTWTITNGTITSGAGAAAIKFTAGSSGAVSLGVTVKSAAGCGSGGFVNVPVNPLPDAAMTAPSEVCPNSIGNKASVPNAGSGAKYSWTITNGTITAGAGTNDITFSSKASGTVTLKVTVTTSSGCTSTTTKTVTIKPSC